MKNFDGIICIGQTTWEGDFQKAVVQLMTELSVRHQIVYVDYQHTWKDWATDSSVRKRAQFTEQLTKKTVDTGGNVHVWRPPLMLPINWLSARPFDWFMRWNAGQLISGLRRAMRQLDINNPLIINAFNPSFGLPMLGELNEAGTIYYCFDEISVANWMSRHGGRHETAYLKRVDAVVTTSEALRRSKSGLQPNAYCVKNGVNFELFNQAREFITARPTDRPVVGYLGTADNRIDVDIVEYCARVMPDVTFQFIGDVHEPKLLQRLSAYPNVVFTPPHRPDQLPPLLGRMTAAMIPFVCNAHTYTIYPLKINEYLAAGLPVVSTPFSLLDDFDGVIDLAGTPADFSQAIRRALTDHSPQRVDERVAMAKANSWSNRADEFDAVIGHLFA